MSQNKKESQMDAAEHGLGFDGLVGLFEQTQTAMQAQAAKSVDIALVVRNWLFGWYIVEFEVCLANLETLNAHLIQQELPQGERLKLLNNTAIQQMRLLTEDKSIKKLEGES